VSSLTFKPVVLEQIRPSSPGDMRPASPGDMRSTSPAFAGSVSDVSTPSIMLQVENHFNFFRE
jgi:hypothetical protein